MIANSEQLCPEQRSAQRLLAKEVTEMIHGGAAPSSYVS